MSLSDQLCTPCRGGIPPLTRTEAEALLQQTPEWRLNADATRLERRYTFKDFTDALAFVDRAGAIAEAQGHHPELCIGWGYCNATLYTHKINGLHQNDFILAAKFDEAYQRAV